MKILLKSFGLSTLLSTGACLNLKVAQAISAPAAFALTACDWSQTLYDGPARMSNQRHEANPILGPKPSNAAVSGYFTISLAALAVAQLLPEKFAVAVNALVIAGEVFAVSYNTTHQPTPCGV